MKMHLKPSFKVITDCLIAAKWIALWVVAHRNSKDYTRSGPALG